MKLRPSLFYIAINAAAAIFAAALDISAQAKPNVPPPADESSYGVYIGVAAIVGLLVLAVSMRKKAAAALKSAASVLPNGGIRMTYRANAKPLPTKPKEPKPAPVIPEPKSGFAALPVSSFVRLQKTNAFLQLPDSNDLSLLDAIEQTNEDSEEDAQVRTQALKLLASFETSNSIAAIAQMALYDLSSKLRSDAVLILAEIDHESVFETIVTCCADPTREVRASAARALFKLNFDRAHSWARIVESGDMARMRHVARCAIEGDIVERSFDRLVHTDRRNAYEAYALTALLVKAGETEPIYKTLARHRDENVKLALLHVLQTIKDDSTFDGLSELLITSDLTPVVVAKANEIRSMLHLSHA